jgi:hypothetical protein
MRESGESLEVLGALSRGYAHLSQLMLPVLDLRFKAFGARSLLYAQRMIHHEPEAPEGYWHRAYALMFIGLPNAAVKDLNKARDHRQCAKFASVLSQSCLPFSSLSPTHDSPHN